MTDVVKLTPSYHIKQLRQFIENERTSRLYRLKGDARRKALAEADNAMESLRAIEGAALEARHS